MPQRRRSKCSHCRHQRIDITICQRLTICRFKLLDMVSRIPKPIIDSYFFIGAYDTYFQIRIYTSKPKLIGIYLSKLSYIKCTLSAVKIINCVLPKIFTKDVSI